MRSRSTRPWRRTRRHPSLTGELPAERREFHRENFPSVRCGEGDPLQTGSAIREHRHEQAFTGQQAFARAQQRADDARLVLFAPVTKDGLHVYAGRHVHHRARFRNRALAWIELYLDELHLGALDLEVAFMLRAPRGLGDGCAAAVEHAGKRWDVLESRPLGHPGREEMRLVVDAAALDHRLDL